MLPAIAGALGESRLRAPALFVGLHLGYVVSVGGDAFPHSRFLVPVLPVLAALAAAGTCVMFRFNRLVGGLGGTCLAGASAWNIFGAESLALLAAVAVLAVSIPLVGKLAIDWTIPSRRVRSVCAVGGLVLVGLAAGKLPERPFPPALRLAQSRLVYESLERRKEQAAASILRGPFERPLVAAGAIGVLGYYGNFPIVDIWGLVDPHIARLDPGKTDLPLIPEALACRTVSWSFCASYFKRLIWNRFSLSLVVPGHRRTNAEYIFSRRPDYIILVDNDLINLTRPVLRGILDHPTLARDYTFDPVLGGFVRLDDAVAR